MSEISCNCVSGCDTKHCPCIKAGRPCSDACRCESCANPLNQIHVDQVSGCAIYNIEKYKHLTRKDLDRELTLPCGCETLPMRKVIGSYRCESCDKVYHYSYCYDEIIEEGSNWNCEFCGSC